MVRTGKANKLREGQLQEQIAGTAAGSPELVKLEAELLEVQTKLSAGGLVGGTTYCLLLATNPCY